ncbi:MAG TPA: DNA polymerase III subunit alpha, partial [Chitinophagaceae bacterium]|nr:DNA polymerase III subunit alpha [Chitinophagaceae bacterium]
KILKFGDIYQSQSASASNTLFGDLQMPEIMPPKIAPCPKWQLVEQLDFEKEVTGMFISGHPLDNFKFELNHYQFMPISDFNEIKNAVGQIPPTRTFRFGGLVIDGQHRLTKTGKNFGILHLEDFSGKTEFMLWSEDYARYSHYLEKGMTLMIEGGFKQRFKTDQYEFKIHRICLLETVKTLLTKQLVIDLEPTSLNEEWIRFMEDNIRQHPGSTSLKFSLNDPEQKHKVSLYTMEKGFNMNDDMISFLHRHPDCKSTVVLS